ncbi:anthranilate phosphoribosyltransferase family protein [Thermoleptolyngbya sp. C42_A2020_037]|uniref:anthranilate phosphoribosyltransferase family protein n=1 Tax=Thermoleptolyngbya sp. C42_A2020_037 TaxID=2747799 RepID=UPI0019EB22D2|nr:anthranilate phosphoribosyltransferase family protein [Thermoleptolyngbya sp. C42_A2020_037]MBF2084490.1 anthranilate phosphoribosyltransferase family protein [Thermoleptolyngbya sp. C42_A2020_037]
MSHAFRALLRKVGSGPHTSQDLTREESAAATRMMLLQEATPAQIGAFMIAHRIKRPTGTELAGMLDAYDELGPKLQSIGDRPVLILNAPYDGRDRTLPLSLVTALILIAAGQPVIQHGGDIMPTKEGVPLVTLWAGLGVDWSRLSLSQIQDVLERTGMGFVYMPTHFPLAQALVEYRDQIGKRPPFATLELIWSPYAGQSHVVVGFVHPPTEGMAQGAFALRGTSLYTTVKGLEGSCDLPRERTAIIGFSPASSDTLERLHLHPYDYGMGGKNVPLTSPAAAVEAMLQVLQGKPSELRESVLWNAGFYLWRGGKAETLTEAIALAGQLLDQGSAWQALTHLRQATSAPCPV